VARLHAGLARLPEADQRIIHLRHVAGLSFKQIADLLEQPLGTVLARQHRALKKLADYVGGGGP
jgi:RNA polymerase sigma-70 factor (ECF subfamily)